MRIQDPGVGKKIRICDRSGINTPDHISERLVTIFSFKVTLNSLPIQNVAVPDPLIRCRFFPWIRDLRWKNPLSPAKRLYIVQAPPCLIAPQDKKMEVKTLKR
jgi:hypothetical protein